MKNTSSSALSTPGTTIGHSASRSASTSSASDANCGTPGARSGTFSKNSGNKKGPGLLLIGVGSMLTSMVAAGFLLGYGVDAVLDTQPIFFLSLGLLGFIGGIMKVYKILTAPELL